jgi:hypothetical protein
MDGTLDHDVISNIVANITNVVDLVTNPDPNNNTRSIPKSEYEATNNNNNINANTTFPSNVKNTATKDLGFGLNSPAKKSCNCRNSRCLKLYCECYNNSVYCHAGCNCVDCLNNNTFEVHQRHQPSPIHLHPLLSSTDCTHSHPF